MKTLIIIFILPMLIIFILIILFDRQNPIYYSKRIGINNSIFLMPKFRTMSLDAPEIATHLLENPSAYYTPIGKFIRKYVNNHS